MKSAWLAGVVSFVLAGVALAAQPPAPIKLFLFAGQSNMVGYLGMNELFFNGVDLSLPQTDINYDYRCDFISRPGGWGPLQDHQVEIPFSSYGSEMSYGRFIKDAMPTEEIAILKVAVGGANLAGRWAPHNNGLYLDAIAFAQDSIARLTSMGYTVEVAGFGWVHGDGDMWSDAHVAAYETNLHELVDTLRLDLNAPNMHAMVSQTHINHNKPTARVLEMRQQKINFVATDGNASLIDVDDLNFRDSGIHFDGTARLTIGLRMVNAYLATLPPPCIPDITGDGILDNGDLNAFIGLFMAGDLAADITGDGILDNGDIFSFITLFQAGCP